MRYTRVIVTHYGGLDGLRVVEEACPEPKAAQVRVRVLDAGVSLPDVSSCTSPAAGFSRDGNE